MSDGGSGGTCRVAMILGTLAPGGFERQVQILATHLDPGKFQVFVIGLAPGGAWAVTLASAGVGVFEVPRRGRWDWRRLLALARLLKRIRPHIVYSFTYENNAYARLAGLLASVPILLTGEGAIYMSGFQALLENLLLPFTECVICNSEAVRRDLIHRVGLSPAKLLTIRNGVALDPLPGLGERQAARHALGAGEGECVIGSVARLETVKNIPMMIEVAALCRQGSVPARFVVVGGGSLESRLRDQISARGLEASFALLGERRSGRELLPGFDIFILSSQSEGLPNAVLEAMAAGLPVVCTDVGGCRELVEEGKTGFLVASGDARGMADCLQVLARDGDLRHRMGRAGRLKCEEEFSADRFIAETGWLFTRLMAVKDRCVRGRRLSVATVHGAD
jgi:glycosyltransferase involved in cell wall biosynthesis